MRLALFCTLLLSSCSLVVPADGQQCETIDDCVMRGFVDATCEEQVCVERPVDPVWGCLGMIEEPMPTSGATHVVTNLIVDAITGTPPPGLTVRLCSAIDLNCESPFQADVPHTNGSVSVTVPSGFQGYLEVASDTTMPAILPMGPVVEDQLITEEIQLASEAIVGILASTAGFSVEPGKGHVLNLMTGCDGMGRAGVSFVADSDAGTQFYLLDLAPDTEATESDESGNGGILNLDPGFVTIQTTRVSTGEFISAKRVLIRDATITYIAMTPTANP